MCDWIIEKMPWCVEHIGNMEFAGQVVLAFFMLALLVAGYCCVYAMVMEALGRWNHFKTTNRFMKILFSFEDDDEYLEWMDRRKWEAEQRERRAWNR